MRVWARARTRTATGASAPGVPAQGSSGSPRRTALPAEGHGAGPLLPSPPPTPEVAAAAGILGGEFDDIVYSGRGDADFTMEETPPPGYVLVDYAWTGSGYFSVTSIDWNGREAVGFRGTVASRRVERHVMWCDTLYPLRFRVDGGARAAWTIVIRPVSAARELGQGATGRNSEVLLHTGPAGELLTRLTPSGSDDILSVRGHKPHRPGAPGRSPVTLASDFGRRREDARALPAGPLLVAVEHADGDWSLEVGEPRAPEPPRRSLWRRLLGR
ncbi:hypothetical protein ACIGHB_22255 [Streptomyces sp. NPDC085460]|uniref:hypothetical protein n=1 Tax=Streptomyces sp. NPDC085460 TaxID=3365723 RepID=UPI0037D392C9